MRLGGRPSGVGPNRAGIVMSESGCYAHNPLSSAGNRLAAPTSWIGNKRATDSERQKAKEVAESVLNRRTTVLEAARELVSRADTDEMANEENRLLIITIESETDDLPIGKVRKPWARYAQEAKDTGIARCEELWKCQFIEACKRIVEA
jgi:hypothetical protein